MKPSPFRFDRPTILAASGGRTSLLMLYLVIAAFHGELPDFIVPVFCNTGKEDRTTLDFVHNSGQGGQISAGGAANTSHNSSATDGDGATAASGGRGGNHENPQIGFVNASATQVTSGGGQGSDGGNGAGGGVGAGRGKGVCAANYSINGGRDKDRRRPAGR